MKVLSEMNAVAFKELKPGPFLLRDDLYVKLSESIGNNQSAVSEKGQVLAMAENTAVIPVFLADMAKK